MNDLGLGAFSDDGPWEVDLERMSWLPGLDRRIVDLPDHAVEVVHVCRISPLPRLKEFAVCRKPASLTTTPHYISNVHTRRPPVGDV